MTRAKYCISFLRRHGSAPSFPMPRFFVAATINVRRISAVVDGVEEFDEFEGSLEAICWGVITDFCKYL